MTLFGQTLDGEQVFGLISLLCMLGLWLAVLGRQRSYARWFRQWEADRKARRDAEDALNGNKDEDGRGPWG